MNALILAAGLGSRLKPFTDKHPKALALVNGKPVLQRNVEYLQQFGIRDVIINVHHFADQVRQAIWMNNGWGSNISISDETDKVLETGGGIKKAGWFLKQSAVCVVMNADVLTDMNLQEMLDSHDRTFCLATLATSNRDTSRPLLFNSSNQLCGWRNNATGEEKIPIDTHRTDHLVPKAFSGISVLNREIFDLFRFEGRFSIIDAYLDLCIDQRIDSFDHSDSKFIDIGTTEKLTAAESLFSY